MVGSVNRQERHVGLDVETTGLSPWQGDRVIEICAVALEGGDLMAEFSTLITGSRVGKSTTRIFIDNGRRITNNLIK